MISRKDSDCLISIQKTTTTEIEERMLGWRMEWKVTLLTAINCFTPGCLKRNKKKTHPWIEKK